MSEPLTPEVERDLRAFLDGVVVNPHLPTISTDIARRLVASLDAARTSQPVGSGLDAAWKAAEAALPEGGGPTKAEWYLEGVGRGPGDGYCATAIRTEVPVWASQRSEFGRVNGLGPTPTAALQALAERLSGSRCTALENRLARLASHPTSTPEDER